jgi:hypothetical protein
MSEPAVVALGPCFVHGGIFAFDPDRVPTVLVDPETSMLPAGLASLPPACWSGRRNTLTVPAARKR